MIDRGELCLYLISTILAGNPAELLEFRLQPIIVEVP